VPGLPGPRCRPPHPGGAPLTEHVPANLPVLAVEFLDDPIGDRLRDTRSVAELVTTDLDGNLAVEVEEI
jgi:hypothetical protein